MNLSDLKYIIEIDRCGSISLAAKNLFVAQSNLSRAVKELEKEFNIAIFQRTSKGVVTTRDGQRFLSYAREIQSQVISMEEEYSNLADNGINLKLSVPRAGYLAEVFMMFMSQVGAKEHIRIHYEEANTMKTIQNIVDNDYDIGIVRYNSLHEGYYLSLLNLKNLRHRLILEFDYLLLTSPNNAIAHRHIRSYAELDGCTEIVYADNRLPSGEYVDLSDNDRDERSQKKVIYVYDRCSAMEYLSLIPNTYMWASPVPQDSLDLYGLVQIRCGAFANYMKDVMVFKDNHVQREWEKQFMDILREKTREYGCYF